MRCDPLTTVSGNPKSQIRNPKQMQKLKPEARFARRKRKKEDQKRIRLGFGILNLEFPLTVVSGVCGLFLLYFVDENAIVLLGSDVSEAPIG